MPRLTASLIESSISTSRQNPLGQWEICLRGQRIPAIENLSTHDLPNTYECIDLSCNAIVHFGNFPSNMCKKNGKVRTMLFCKNGVRGVDSSDRLKRALNGLKVLSLEENRLERLSDIKMLGEALGESLEDMVLIGNPVTRRQYYRLFTIACMPSLKNLDYARITATERKTSERLLASAAGAALQNDVTIEGRRAEKELKNGVQTFNPGEGGDVKEGYVANFSVEEKEKIKEMIGNAKSADEIERFEESVRRGVFPKGDTV
mmetsp:Transcript_5097/g.10751  ORF Transcript_5097/g.10751 Transcript_5097/m.10751 type:complete len:261 (-) Transcript_5097:160-942(-)